MKRSIVVAITGASGAIYATRTVAALLERGCHIELVVSDYGRRLLRDELGDDAAIDKLMDYLLAAYGEGVRAGTYTLHSNKDLGAKIASGSQNCDSMVIVPCSMKTLAGVAHGLSRNLIERAADVMLKERRKLILLPRETPMSLPQLRNMSLCAEAGAMLMPAMPAFYQMPQTLDDLANFMAGKILAALGFEHELYPAWKGCLVSTRPRPESPGCSTRLLRVMTSSTASSVSGSIADGATVPYRPLDSPGGARPGSLHWDCGFGDRHRAAGSRRGGRRSRFRRRDAPFGPRQSRLTGSGPLDSARSRGRDPSSCWNRGLRCGNDRLRDQKRRGARACAD